MFVANVCNKLVKAMNSVGLITEGGIRIGERHGLVA